MNITQIAAIAGIVAGLGGPTVGYVATTARLEERASSLRDEIKRHDEQFKGIYQFDHDIMERSNTLASGLVAAHSEVSLMGSDIKGDLKVVQSDLRHVIDTVDEIRGEQRKHAIGGALSGGSVNNTP